MTLGQGTGPGGEDAGLEPGTSMGHYPIVRRLGAGGMGVVFAARDGELDRMVALKLVRRADDPGAVGGAPKDPPRGWSRSRPPVIQRGNRRTLPAAMPTWSQCPMMPSAGSQAWTCERRPMWVKTPTCSVE